MPEHLSFVWQAFWHLHSDRPAGMGGPVPISFASVDRYACRYGIDDVDEFDRVLRLIQFMDGAYLEWANAKSKQKQQNQ